MRFDDVELVEEHFDEEARPASALVRWLETVGLSIALPALGLALRRVDPLFLRGGFPWIGFAPLLVGLRHGFLPGLVSAVLVDAAVFAQWAAVRHGSAPPVGLGLGLLVLGMIAGEFSDGWSKRLQRHAEREGERNRERRLFARAYHLLADSHERLERRVRGNTRSMREALTEVNRRLIAARGRGREALVEDSLALFAAFGDVQVAALHAVENGAVQAAPIGLLGTPDVPLHRDPIVRDAVARRETLGALGGPLAGDSGPVVVAVPLCDVDDRVHAVLAVEDLPFLSLTGEHLSLLSLIGGMLADAWTLADGGVERAFDVGLARTEQQARQHGLGGVLVGMRFTGDASALRKVLDSRRGLDLPLVLADSVGRPVLFMILPLSDDLGARRYLERLDTVLAELGGLVGAGVEARRMAIDGTGDARRRFVQFAGELDVARA